VAQPGDEKREVPAVLVGEERERHHRSARHAEADRARDTDGGERLAALRVVEVHRARRQRRCARGVGAPRLAVARRAVLGVEPCGAPRVRRRRGRLLDPEAADDLGAQHVDIRGDVRRRGFLLEELPDLADLASEIEPPAAGPRGARGRGGPGRVERGLDLRGDPGALGRKRELLVVLALRDDHAVLHGPAVVGCDVAEEVDKARRFDLGRIPLIPSRPRPAEERDGEAERAGEHMPDASEVDSHIHQSRRAPLPNQADRGQK
jgi:hypothetical protein